MNGKKLSLILQDSYFFNSFKFKISNKINLINFIPVVQKGNKFFYKLRVFL